MFMNCDLLQLLLRTVQEVSFICRRLPESRFRGEKKKDRSMTGNDGEKKKCMVFVRHSVFRSAMGREHAAPNEVLELPRNFGPSSQFRQYSDPRKSCVGTGAACYRGIEVDRALP